MGLELPSFGAWRATMHTFVPTSDCLCLCFLSTIKVTRPESEPTSLSRLGNLRTLQDVLAGQSLVVFVVEALLVVLPVSLSILIPRYAWVYALADLLSFEIITSNFSTSLQGTVQARTGQASTTALHLP
jgi:hypothetical protein